MWRAPRGGLTLTSCIAVWARQKGMSVAPALLRSGPNSFCGTALRSSTRAFARSATFPSHVQPIAFKYDGQEKRAEEGRREGARSAGSQRGGRNSEVEPKVGGYGAATRKQKTVIEAPVRLAKALADAGIASRRAAEGLIAEGRVKVNGQVQSSPAINVTPGKDVLEFDGKKIASNFGSTAIKKYYFALHKPRGYLCSNEKGGEKLVLDLFADWVERWKERNEASANLSPRLFTVGRLDVGTSGLIFVTNDGDWCQRISHPSSRVTKEYVLRGEEHVTRRQIETILAGCEVDGVHVRPLRCETVANVDGGGKNRIVIEVMDGRNREVRRLAENAGVNVASLKRTRIGEYKLPYTLKMGQYLELSQKEAVMVAGGAGAAAGAGGGKKPQRQQREVGSPAGRQPQPLKNKAAWSEQEEEE